MNLRRRTLMLALGLAPLGALAQARQPARGVDYTELSPTQPVETQGKIEVIEFFWYGCPHCYTLEPLLEKWAPTLPADVQFRRVPAVLNPNWGADAVVFYAFEALGALVRRGRKVNDAADAAQQVAPRGVRPELAARRDGRNALRLQRRQQMPADEAGRSGDQNLHRREGGTHRVSSVPLCRHSLVKTS